MRINKIVLLCIILIGSLPIQASQLTAKQKIEDVNYLVENVVNHHVDFYKKHVKQDFLTAAEQLKENVHALSEHEFIVGMSTLLSRAKDGHSFIRGYHPLFESEFGNGIAFESTPIRLYNFNDGIYIYATQRNYAQYLGAKVTHINGHDVSAVLETVSQMFPVENSMAVKSWGVYGLVAPKILNAFGIMNSYQNASYTLEIDGKTINVTFPAQSENPKEELGVVADSQWSNLADTRQLTLQHKQLAVWQQYLAQEKIVYVKINGFPKSELSSIEQFVDQAIESSNRNSSSKLVLDIRHHPGGETKIVNSLVKKIAASKANQEKRLYVIIGRRTFSAAQLFATGLEQYTYATFVGEPTGINVHFFGNARNNITLPNSKLKIFLATSWWQTTNMSDERKWQAPNISATASFKDYIQGVDPALNAIINNVLPQDINQHINALQNNMLSFDEFELAYKAFKADPFNEYTETEESMNGLGYKLIEENKISQAITVFKLNVKDYPNSSNGYDSLAEAYLKIDNNLEASKVYRKILAIDPSNKHAQMMIAELDK